MKRILKFKVAISDEVTVVPALEVKHIGEQYGEILTAWCTVDGDLPPLIPLRLHVFGTGHKIPADLMYVGTAQMTNGLVWHVFKE